MHKMLLRHEEPPSYAVIILCADNVNALLPTIISRCQTIPMRRMSREDISTILTQRGVLSSEADVFARMSEGLPGRAIDLSLDEDFKDLRRDVIDYLDSLFSMDKQEMCVAQPLWIIGRY